MGEALRPPDSFRDGRLVLVPPIPSDVDLITEICQDPDIQRFTRVPVPYGRQDAEPFVAMATEALQQGRGAHLLVEMDGTVVGCVGAGIDPTDDALPPGTTAPSACSHPERLAVLAQRLRA